MAGRVSHPDDSESDWDSISQPVPQQSPPGISTETNRLQCDEPNLDEGAQLDESSDQEVDATESGTIHDAPETARFAENQTKRELNKRSLSGDSQDLPSLPYDRHRSSPKSQDNKNFCNVPDNSDENKLTSWGSGLPSFKGNQEHGAFLTDISDITIRSQKSTAQTKINHESYLFKADQWELPPLNGKSQRERVNQTGSNIFTKHEYNNETKNADQAVFYGAYTASSYPDANQKEYTQDRLNQLPLSNGETQVNLTDELTEMFPYERCNVDFHEASEKRTRSFTDNWNAQVSNVSNSFWTEVTSVLKTPFLFLLAFILQLIRFVTAGLVRPLIVGLLRGISDGLLKPVLSVLHNAFLVPAAVFVHNVGLALYTALTPIGSIISIVTDALGRLLQSFRLVEVHLHSGGTSQKKYHVGRDHGIDKITLERV